MEIPLGPVTFAPEAGVAFPNMRCCNCGTAAGLSVKEQDTKKTNYFLLAGTELTFRLPLPVCGLCEKSLKRRAPTIVHKLLLLFLVAFTLFFLIAMSSPDFLLRFQVISNNLFYFCLGAAFLLLWGFYALRRPSGTQTSFYQPVRLGTIKRAFMSGKIEAIGFRFTNADYMRDFMRANASGVQSGHVLADQTRPAVSANAPIAARLAEAFARGRG